MSIAAPAHPAVSSAAAPRFKLAHAVLIAWFAIAASAVLGGPAAVTQMSTDDYMRLVQVRDLLAGQGWFDLTQYRLNPPMGMVSHWTRIVDAPLALLISGLTPLVGRASAEWAAMTLWPPFLYLPTLALVGLLARRLSDERAALPAIVLTAVSAAVLVHFRPGALDHHGTQLLLLVATLYGATERGGARLVPALGGLAAAVSIAIGLEMLPALAAILAAVGLRWAIDGEETAPLTSSFGLAFGFGAVGLFAVTVPPASWTEPRYDEISIVWMAAAALAGGAIALLAAASRRLATMRLRLCTGVAAGAGCAALVLAVFPHAFDLFGEIDPLLEKMWLAHIMELRGALDVIKSPVEALPILVPPLAALALGIAALIRCTREERMRYLPPLFALLALLGVSLWGLRSLAAANLIAQPILAAALLRLMPTRARETWGVRYIGILALLSGPLLLLAGQGLGSATATSRNTKTVLSCYHAADVAALERLPAGLVLAFIDAGPAILATTPHAVLAAPYHRDNDGNLFTYRAFLSGEPDAQHLLHARHVDYVALCPHSSDAVLFGSEAPQGLAARLARGEIPPYLQLVPGDPAAPMRVFRVR